MATLTGGFAGVFSGNNLFEERGFGRIFLVAGTAQNGDGGFHRLEDGRIPRVLIERAVAGFAGNAGVPALGPDFGLLGVAIGTGLVSSKPDRRFPDFLQHRPPIVAILAERGGNHRVANGEKDKGKS